MPSSHPIPALSPYGTFHGALFQYRSFPSLVAFESTPTNTATPGLSPNKCILLGGLSDGLIPTPYTSMLETKCHELGWSLVQPILSSSYLGFGNGSLQRDTEEISMLLRYLQHHRSGETFAIVGHSTGCQNSCHFTRYGDSDMVSRTKVIALQAPVSDREGPMEDKEAYSRNIAYAKKLHEAGRGNEMMPRSTFWAPITASRFLDLQDYNGADDFFSSDLSLEELSEKLDHFQHCGDRYGLRTLVAFSGKDEYVAKHVDPDALVHKLCRAMNGHFNPKNDKKHEDLSDYAIPLLLEDGNHNLSKGEGDGQRFVNAVGDLLASAAPSEIQNKNSEGVLKLEDNDTLMEKLSIVMNEKQDDTAELQSSGDSNTKDDTS